MGYLTDCLLRCPTIEALCTLVPGGDDAGWGTYDNSIMGQCDKLRHLLIAGEQLSLLLKQLITLNKSSNHACGCSRKFKFFGIIFMLSFTMVQGQEANQATPDTHWGNQHSPNRVGIRIAIPGRLCHI